MAPRGERLDQCCSSADVVVQHQVARIGEGLDGGAREHRAEPGRVLVEAMRQAAHGFTVARAVDQRRLGVFG